MMDVINITPTFTPLPPPPPMLYDWQIYPMEIKSKELSENTNALFYARITILVWREKVIKTVFLDYDNPMHYYIVEQADIVADAFYKAQEFVFHCELDAAPIATCADPPSMEYEPCHCGADCDYYDANGEPCWGEVVTPNIPDGDEGWRHACAGHLDRLDGGEYTPELKVKP